MISEGAGRESKAKISGRLAFALGTMTLLLACKASPGTAPPASAELPEGVVARVGRARIDGQAVAAIASSNAISPETARSRAVSDALFAEEARARLAPAEVASITRSALGRALLEEIAREAELDPVTDREVEEATEERWLELDRPESARVVHAVALHGSDRAAARRAAEAIQAAVAGVTDPKLFLERAKAVKQEGVELRAERLPAMTADGRAVVLDRQNPRANHFDVTFAKAANALENPGDQSPIVETEFGFHVLLLEAKLPAVRLSLQDRRRILEKELRSKRAGELRRALVNKLTQSTRIEVVRDFDARTAGLSEP